MKRESEKINKKKKRKKCKKKKVIKIGKKEKGEAYLTFGPHEAFRGEREDTDLRVGKRVL